MNRSTLKSGSVAFFAAMGFATSASAAPQLGPWLKTYNVYVGGDIVYACSRLDGSVGAAGQARFNRMAISTIVAKKTYPGVATGGAFSLYDGSIQGDVEAGGNARLRNYSVGKVTSVGTADCGSEGTHKGCSGTTSATVDHVAAKREIAALSRSVEQDLAYSIRPASDGTISIKVPAGTTTVSLSAESLMNAKRVEIDAPYLAVVHVRVTSGNSVTWAGRGNIVLKGGITPATVMWTFVNVLDLVIHHSTIIGTVLAPRADVVFYEGKIDGNLYVGGSLFGNPNALSIDSAIDCSTGDSGGHVALNPFLGSR